MVTANCYKIKLWRESALSASPSTDNRIYFAFKYFISIEYNLTFTRKILLYNKFIHQFEVRIIESRVKHNLFIAIDICSPGKCLAKIQKNCFVFGVERWRSDGGVIVPFPFEMLNWRQRPATCWQAEHRERRRHRRRSRQSGAHHWSKQKSALKRSIFYQTQACYRKLTRFVWLGYWTRISSVFLTKVSMRVRMVASLSSARLTADCSARLRMRVTMVSGAHSKYRMTSTGAMVFSNAAPWLFSRG